MSTGSKSRLPREYSEAETHRWLKGVDLGKFASRQKFKQTTFPSLRPTNWHKLYEDFQRTRPISIRLPVRVLDKLKQISLQKGIGYQALIQL